MNNENNFTTEIEASNIENSTIKQRQSETTLQSEIVPKIVRQSTRLKPSEIKQTDSKISGFQIFVFIAVLILFVFYLLFFTGFGNLFITNKVSDLMEEKIKNIDQNK